MNDYLQVSLSNDGWESHFSRGDRPVSAALIAEAEDTKPSWRHLAAMKSLFPGVTVSFLCTARYQGIAQ